MMEPFEPLQLDDPDIQELISRWAGESKRLLVALPGVLAKLEDLQEDTSRLRERVSELERENVALRESREELAETFAKLKALIAGTSMAATMEVDAPRPRSQPSEPSQREASAPTPSASPSAERSRPPASPPAPRVDAEPNARVLSREDKPSKPEEATPSPTSVRFSSVFRPPTKS